MRIGIDVSPLTAQRTGVGNYCFYLLKHLLGLGTDHGFVGFSSGRGPIDLGVLNGRLPNRHIPVPTRLLYKSWEWLKAPAIDTLLGPLDVYHATNYFTPPAKKARRVVTIHDLSFLAIPELSSPRIVGPFSKNMRRFAHEADAIMAYSQATKGDIVRFLEVDPRRITVAPMAVDDGFAPMSREEAETYLLKHYDIEPPFLLFVSTLEPRKNVTGLLEAFKKAAADMPHNLVLVGGMGWQTGPIQEALNDPAIRDRIIRPGFVEHMELPAFYGAADAFVFPTHYEGFGLPLLEALTCGCPVVSADNSSVPEVTGGAALLSDSRDTDAVAENIRRILSDNELRANLIERGKAHAQNFSWRACAAKTMDVYEGLTADP